MLIQNTKQVILVIILLVVFTILVSSIVNSHLHNIYSIAKKTPMPVIIDTDMMYDDCLAILTVLQEPHVSVKAITISGTGGAHLEPGADNLLKMLDYIAAPNIPVAYGTDKPLFGNKAFPYGMRKDTDDIGSYLEHMLHGFPKKTRRHISDKNAIDLMYNILKNSKQKVTILALAPLTNIAQLFKSHPDIKKKINTVYIMGGAINVDGNLYPTGTEPFIPKEYRQNKKAEWNIFVDALAADEVFHSGAQIVLVPLDATNRTQLTNKSINGLKETVNNSDDRILKLFYAILADAINDNGSIDGLFLWDVVPAVMLGGNNYIANIEPLNLKVALKDKTPEDKKNYGAIFESKTDMKKNDKVYVAMDLDKNGFFKQLNYLLSGRTVALKN